MSAADGHRSRWEELDHNCPNRFAEITRWRVGNLAQELNRMQHDGQGAQLVGEIEAWRHRLERQETVRAEGWNQGEPGA